MSASPGWYPDPGGGQGLFRYWDGKAWSAAVSPNPSAPPPAQGLVGGGTAPQGDNPYGQAGQPAYGQSPYGDGYDSAYANYQEHQKKKSPLGWWIAGGALVIVIVVVAVLAVRAVTGGDTGTTGGPAAQPSQDVCPPQITPSPEPSEITPPTEGSTEVRSPIPSWARPGGLRKVTLGCHSVATCRARTWLVENDYDGNGGLWVASIIVGELQAGDGFFTPEQGAQIVVRCIVGGAGEFYGDNPVNSNVKVNEKTTIDGHEAWLVESQLTFDIAGLKTKGELLIIAIVSAGNRSGLYYASIPDTTPELVQPARDALRDLKVDS